MPIPENFQEIDLGMSNFDNSIDKNFKEAIVDKEYFGRHAAWNFTGFVYHKDGQFHEDIWQYNSYCKTKSAVTLKELMEDVNEEFGYE